MAKKKSYPKKPKLKSSLKVWQNYDAACKKVDTFNKKQVTDKKAKEKIRDKSR